MKLGCGLGQNGAQERTRTFTAVKPLAPEASASTNSATWARGRLVRIGRSLVKLLNRCPNKLYSARVMAYRETAKTPDDRSRLTGRNVNPHGIESGHPGHGFRRIGLSGAKRGPRALQA